MAEAFLSGYLARNDAAAARSLLEKMSSYFSDKSQEDYLWGVFLLQQGDVAGARIRLARVVEIQPGHELARAKLGDILEANDDLEGALRQFAELAARSGEFIPARVALVACFFRRAWP